MIGSEALAREILNFPFWGREFIDEDYHTGDKYLHLSHDFSVLPEGWSLAGAGTSRVAFKGPDGVVYKVSQDFFWQTTHFDRLSDNFMEAYIYAEFSDIVAHETNGAVRMAECHYFYDLDVIAMEYSERVDDAPYEHIEMLNDIRMGGDLHGGNVWSDRRGTVLVDYGYVRALNRLM